MSNPATPHKPASVALTPDLKVTSRVVEPRPPIVNPKGAKPSLRTVYTGPAGSDNVICQFLGYEVRALTLVTPGSSSNMVGGANTDSVYLDLEDINVQAGAEPATGPFELPPGTALTIENVDPGWIHFSSPTANQKLSISYGGRPPGA